MARYDLNAFELCAFKFLLLEGWFGAVLNKGIKNFTLK